MTAPAGSGPELHTRRLLLRRWRKGDRAAFARMNGNPEMREFFPTTLNRAESDALVDRIEAGFEEHGFGIWAVEAVDVAEFIGSIGLNAVEFTSWFTPAVEVGWRVDRPFWGKGYATEAAQAAIAFGFEKLGLSEIVAFTVPANMRSRRVMERIGMRHDASGDFDHPRMPEGHHLQRHVLYRLSRSDWITRAFPQDALR